MTIQVKFSGTQDLLRVFDVFGRSCFTSKSGKADFFESNLVGGFNPFEKNSQNGNLPKIGVKIKNI